MSYDILSSCFWINIDKTMIYQYCPSGKTPRLINVCVSLNRSFIMAYAMLTTFIYTPKYIL